MVTAYYLMTKLYPCHIPRERERERERKREWKHTAGVWEVRVRDGGAPVEHERHERHERQQHHAPAPLPPQRRLVLGLRLGGQMQGLRRAPHVVVVAMRAPAEREREKCRTRMPGRKETAASAKEQNSVRCKAAATPGSQSKSSRKLQTTDESNLIESQTQAN